MTSALNLDAYFERVGYSGPHTATLETLATLHLLHPRAIPFENLNPFLGLPVPLDVAALERKLVHGGRGGYCYEHNLLFGSVLTGLGFHVTGLAARALWNVPEGTVRPRSHMLLRVSVSGAEHLADVGFGGLTLTGPLRFEPDVAQATPHETIRLVRVEYGLEMQAMVKDGWKALYQFGDEPHVLADYEMGNWYVSTHPTSPFRTDLIAARAGDGVRHTLRNREQAIHRLDGSTQRWLLASGAAIRTALERTFGLDLSDLPGVDDALDRVAVR